MTTLIIGAGMGGLSAAIALAAKGERVIVLEAQSGSGGKMLPVHLGGLPLDSGPTVLTMRWVFEELFALAGANFDLEMEQLSTLARHYWSGGVSLDLFADHQMSMDAIGQFAGRAEAEGYLNFSAAAKRIHQSLLKPFLKSQRPTPFSLATSMPLRDVLGINPFETYWHALGRYFKDPRLQQLFGRYATYCGSSPFKAPATLMLVADVEACGVWRVRGGMAALAQCMEQQARKLGVEFHFSCAATRIELAHGKVSAVIDATDKRHACTSVIVNADSAYLATLLGQPMSSFIKPKDNSLSAITWCAVTQEQGVPLAHHTVFFSDDYKQEFVELAHRSAQDPTIYICDQGLGRKLLLINAPASAQDAVSDVEASVMRRLEKSGLTMNWNQGLRRSPLDFATLYPASNGALYGRAAHGWLSTFQRPKARSKIHGLYLAGGTTHPGPGVPMAALSGMRAAEALWQDQPLM